MRRAASGRLMQLSMASRPRRGLLAAASPSASLAVPRMQRLRSLLTAPVSSTPSLAQRAVRRQREPPIGPPLVFLPDLRRIPAGTATAVERLAASSENGAYPEAVPSAEAGQAQLIHQVEWSSELANTITLIGHMGSDPELKTLPSGVPCVSFNIAYKPPTRRDGIAAEKPPEWHKIEVYNELALEAARQLRRGLQIAVHGRLRIDQWTDRASGVPKQRPKVVADQVAIVRPLRQVGDGQPSVGAGPATSAGRAAQSQYPQHQNGSLLPAHSASGPAHPDSVSSAQPPKSKAPNGPADIRWEKYFDDPSAWWDNRSNKTNPKAPDFVNKLDRSLAIWVKGAPAWALQQLKARGIADETSGIDDPPF